MKHAARLGLLVFAGCILGSTGCGGGSRANTGGAGGGGSSPSTGGAPGGGSGPSTGGASSAGLSSGGSGNTAATGTGAGGAGSSSSGSGNTAATGTGGGGTQDAGPSPDPCVEAGTCPIGTWTNVSPTGLSPADLFPASQAYGPGSVVADPARPSDLYIGGSASGLWKSTDYGYTWAQLATAAVLPNVPRGTVIAVAGTTPATIWAAGWNQILKSTDGGLTFTGTALSVMLYSLQVDPHDPTHLISGVHEDDGVYESTDGGTTWKEVTGPGWPSGGISWYPFFVDTGSAATTRTTWFAIAQDGASAIMTSDGGAHWNIPSGISGLQHPHGNAQLFQSGSSLFVAGTNGPGQGVYRSPDLGVSWSRVDSGNNPEAIVWGSKKSVYSMYAWACSGCNSGPNFETAPLPGTSWSNLTVPAGLVWGPNGVAVTYDGSHYVFVAVMWSYGIWRYVEP